MTTSEGLAFITILVTLGLALLGAQRAQIKALFEAHSKLADERHRGHEERARALEEALDDTKTDVSDLKTRVSVVENQCRLFHGQPHPPHAHQKA